MSRPPTKIREIEAKHGKDIASLLIEMLEQIPPTHVARELGISKGHFYYWLKKLGIKVRRKNIVTREEVN